MFQLLETIKCSDGKLHNLEWHNLRFNQARKECFGIDARLNLAELINIPEKAQAGLFRCRIIYSTKIEKIEFLPHVYRKVDQLKLVEDNSIDYRFKYADRTHLQKLFEKRVECDDILIIKDGCITDSLTANSVFFDGKKWWTPDTPLLLGTQRAQLLKNQTIFECRITPKDLNKYEKAGLINALQDLSNMPLVSVKSIQL